MILWLDDVREPWRFGHRASEWAKTADEVITLLKTGRVTFASLDHDLAEEHYSLTANPEDSKEKTGYSVILFLEEYPEFWPQAGVSVHSLNNVGRAKMLMPIERHYGRNFQDQVPDQLRPHHKITYRT